MLSAGCGEQKGDTFTVRTMLLAPADVPDPLAGLDRVRLRVVEDGGVLGEREFAPGDPWEIPANGVDGGDTIHLRVDGLDTAGTVIRTGRTRAFVPDESEDRVFGIYFSTPGSFSPPPTTPALPRTGAHALVLPDGRAVVFGGEDETGAPLADVTLYDPDTGAWRALAPLSTARISPALAVLADGLTVLVAGGDSGAGLLDDTELYRVPASGADPADAGETAAGPDLPMPWYAMQAASLPSGRVVLAGGYAGGAPAPCVFDPATGSLFELAGGVFAEAASVAATGDGRVAIVGGGSPETASRVDLVSEDTSGTVSLTTGVGVLRVPRRGASAIALDSARLLVTGGEVPTGGLSAGVEVVDLSGPARSTLVERERVHRSVRPVERIGDGRVLLAGGRAPDGAPTARAFVFDAATNRVEETGTLPEPVTGRRYTAPLPDGTALLFGGDGSLGVWIFQPPVEPLDGGDRVTLTVSIVEGQRAMGGVLDGAATLRVRFFDSSSEVLESVSAPGASATVPGFVPDQPVHVLLQAEDAAGTVLAWGATSSPIDQAAQQAGALTLLVGRVGEFVLAPEPMPSAHRDGAAAQLADGRVVVVGGADALDATDVFDPGTGGVSTLTNTAIPLGRRDVRAVVDGGRLLVTGGRDGAGNDTTAHSILDLTAGTWSAGDPLPAPGRAKHTLVALGDGRVLTHGLDATDGLRMPADLWDGVDWSPLVPGRKRSHHTGVLLGDGTVLLAAGIATNGAAAPVISNTAEVFDPVDLSFTPTAGNLTGARRDHAAFPDGAGGAVLCGGLTQVATSAPIGTCERYDPMTGTFVAAGSLSEARDDSAVVTLPDGTSWVLGGALGTGGDSSAAVDVWDGAIAPGPSLRIARAMPASVALRDGRIVAACGFDDATGDSLATVELHTPSVWTNPFGY